MDKKRQYRIVETGEGFYTQTRTKGYLFWNEWLTFTKYNISSEEIGLRFPHETFEDAIKTIENHKSLISKRNKKDIVKVHNL